MVRQSEGSLVASNKRRLTSSEFGMLAEIPTELEWFANIQNENTRLAYKKDIEQFMTFAGIREPVEFRQVKRAHLIAWRKQLESQTLESATIRRKLTAVSSLFNHLCESNAVAHNPTNGVIRPNAGSDEGKSPALSETSVAWIN